MTGKLFTKAELKAFNDFNDNQKFDTKIIDGETCKCIKDEDLNKYIELQVKFLSHKQACQEIGVVGVGCFHTYQN